MSAASSAARTGGRVVLAALDGASSNAQSYSSVSSKYILPNFRSGMAARFLPDSEQPKSPRGSPIKRVPTKLAGHTWRAVSLTEEESTAELRDFVGSVVGANTTVDRQALSSGRKLEEAKAKVSAVLEGMPQRRA